MDDICPDHSGTKGNGGSTSNIRGDGDGAARHTRRRIALDIIKLHGHTGMAKKDPSTKEANAMKGMPVLKAAAA